ncbi:hypothetical protein [Alteraurantiacibacter aquimixticola]|uniref:Uracil-DNA glycosylase-like domain-containing protein n=1 Tax=Alteraurantiacibacter aquimixticola TaxID=2489173 RepID=A0A4T3F0B2_9SPHN|nr:hypothetical protein [Alteraurantiacibacter aquimixticola]TIX49947.1 hypothetical protein E5222_06470 [Alteraurantiacibacter aquimixticola]
MQQQPDLAEQFAAALDWWREAGVDHDFRDEAEALLQEPKAAKAAAEKLQQARKVEEEKPAPPAIGGDRANWPGSLEGFASWWMTEPSLDGDAVRDRVAPRGVVEADLMVLVPMPEAQDSEKLLSGPQGTLVSNMLRAMGVAEERAYIASALPRHMPLADWDGLGSAGLGEVLQHHIKLAAPKRLLVLGRDLMPVLGLEKRQAVAELSLGDSAIHLLASFGPENLLENARLRARLWHSWLDWTGNR